MLSSSLLENVAYRFQPFVAELRSFLKENNVAYGFPEHLLAFTQKISTGTLLRNEVSAELLEVIRESEQPVSHGELVELLLVTVGGANIDEDTPTIQKAERVLSQLVGEVMTSRDGLFSLEHPAHEAPPDPHAQQIANPSALDTAEPDIPIKSNHPAPEAIAWASPPAFVWAAVLLGALLPPSMYFLSRPHPVQPIGPQNTTSSVHSAVRPGPATAVLPAPYELKPLDLDFGDAPAPKHRSHTPPPNPAPTAVRDTNTQPTQDLSSDPTPQAEQPAPTGPDKTSRATDMPGRDLGLPAPTLASPQLP